MKELSFIDLEKIIQEIQFLIDGKIDQIYMPAKKELLLQIHVPNIGKSILRILVPNFIYLTEFKPEGNFPPGYCMFLRKKLLNSRIRDIRLLENERVVVFTLTTKDSEYELFVEFFLKGNVILCQDNKIISPLENQNWKDRTVRGGIKYILPKKEYKELGTKLDMSLVKFLATEQNLGGNYAEEICARLELKKYAEELTDAEIKKIKNEIRKMHSAKPKGFVYSKQDNIVAITPFEMKIFSEDECKKFKTFNEALNSVLTRAQKKEIHSSMNKQFDLKRQKYEKIIKAQTRQLERIEKIIEESKAKGEAIYTHYSDVKDILEGNLKHEKVKKIDKKKGILVVEL